jgi:hypothetical protein
MVGKYFAVDYCSGQFWSVEEDDSNQWVIDEVSGTEGFGWSTFGHDVNGEMYVVNQQGGTVYHLIDEDCLNFEPSINIAIGANELAVDGALDMTTVSWYLDGNLIPDETGNVLNATEEGLYMVEFTSPEGCYGVSDELFFSPNSVYELTAPWDLRSFPNPSSDVLTLSVSGGTDVVDEVLLVNAIGKTVYSEFIGQAGTDIQHTIDVSAMAAGQYSLLIRSGKRYFDMQVTVSR